MDIQRTNAMVDGEPVYHLVGYDDGTPVITVPVYPKNPARWLSGAASKRERDEVGGLYAKGLYRPRTKARRDGRSTPS